MTEKTFTELWREGRQAEIRRLWQEQRDKILRSLEDQRGREIRDAWRAGREAEAKKISERKGCRFWPFGKGV